jgi:lysophospholipase
MLSLICIASLAALVSAAPSTQRLEKRANAYAPVLTTCPTTPIIRPATAGIGLDEQAYFDGRKPLADDSLKAWLTKVGFTATPVSEYPSVGLTVSGGGYRSMLSGGGVVQAFDDRDSTSDVSGLYQAFTYHAGLSGGGWLLSSIAGNNWPTVSNLQAGLWTPGLAYTLAAPGGADAPANQVLIAVDIISKFASGYEVTLTDPWGRLLSYQLLYGADGGVATTLSGIVGNSNFVSRSVPYPIITAIETYPDQCLPDNGNTQFEMHPYEFGSWDKGVKAFIETEYLGTTFANGVPAGSCTTNFDNLGFILGTSSNLFSEACADPAAAGPSAPLGQLVGALEGFLAQVTVDAQVRARLQRDQLI